MDSAIHLAIITAIVAPTVLAALAGIKWVFDKMERRLQTEIDELRADKRVLQGKVDQMLAEAIRDQRQLILAYQRNSEVNKQVLSVVDDNSKVLDTTTKALEKLPWKP